MQSLCQKLCPTHSTNYVLALRCNGILIENDTIMEQQLRSSSVLWFVYKRSENRSARLFMEVGHMYG